ncbi:hypothetical protein CYMTET_30940 [Cymbomonas tetramitiformis]|uniref:FAD-binding PCMH-type domain-containing protein n=1 Tax=Cymbomonas tetramitiformis TaxID=36881 RepID=A0AAE0KTG0_9CHLO|nr:hypothetical protein CYMTET_44974 [Cymbomonas tetramitiformis]KAK3260088.1 hypothetical protein CYMTET_30940 [Cymbomonas tetramitiformis]
MGKSGLRERGVSPTLSDSKIPETRACPQSWQVEDVLSVPVNALLWGLALLTAWHFAVLTLPAAQGVASNLWDEIETLPRTLISPEDVSKLARRHPFWLAFSGLALLSGLWTVRALLRRGPRQAASLTWKVCRLCGTITGRIARVATYRVRAPLFVLLCIWGAAAHHPLPCDAAVGIPGLVEFIRPLYFTTTNINKAVSAVTYSLPMAARNEFLEFVQQARDLAPTCPQAIALPILFVLALGAFRLLRWFSPVVFKVTRVALVPIRRLLSDAWMSVHVGPLVLDCLLAGNQVILPAAWAVYTRAILLPTSRSGILALGAVAFAVSRLARRLRTPLSGKQGEAGVLGKGPVADDVTRLNATEVDRVWYPRTEADVSDIIRLAREHGRHVSCRGQSHTMGGHTIAVDGYVLDLGNLNQVEHDTEAETVTCGPGATWGDLIRHLNRFGMSPRTMQSYCSFSVGGTIAVNAHGITTDYSMYESVLSMRVVDANGEVTVVTRETRPELFGRVIGGFGLFGIVTQLTLKANKNHKLSMEMIKLSASEFPALYRRCLVDDSIDVKLTRVDITNSTDLYLFVFRRSSEEPTVSDLEPFAREMGTVTKLLYKWVMPLRIFQRVRYLVEDYTQQPLDWAGECDRNTLMHESAVPLARLSNIIIDVDDTFVLQEYFVPDLARDGGGNLQSWLARSRPILWAAHQHVTLLNITIRYVRADACTALPYAPTDSYAFVLYFRVHRTEAGDAELAQIHHDLVALTSDLGGTFYLPYRHHYTDEELEAAYPSIARFFADKQRIDPQNVFSNAWYRRYGARHVDVLRTPGPIRRSGRGGAGSRLTRGDRHRARFEEPFPEVAHIQVPMVDDRRSDSYAEVFNDPVKRQKLRLFLANQFHIEDPSVLYSYIARSVWAPHTTNDLTVYRDLKAHLEGRSLQGALAIRKGYRQLQQLGQQTTEVMEQLSSLLADLGRSQRRDIKDVMTIGDPGRLVLPLKRLLGINGRVWVVHDKERGAVDAVERGSFSAVGRFVPIDYDNVDELPIPSCSVDLVTISMGLHHFQQCQLARVLCIVRRVLRPGGLFIVREHDARPEVLPIADLAHSVFNAVMGVSEEEEAREVRAFRTVLQWREVLHSAGLEDSYVYRNLSLDRDPTEDVMMAFVKPSPEGQGRDAGAPVPHAALASPLSDDAAHVKRVCRAAQESLVTSGVKPVRSTPDSTFFRLPEWLLVTAAQELGNSLNHTVWYQFPYVQFVSMYWDTFEKELRVVAQDTSVWDAVYNGGTFMDLMIGIVITLLFLQMQLLALLALALFGSEPPPNNGEQLVVEADDNVDWASVDSCIRATRLNVADRSAQVYAWLIVVPKYTIFTPVMLKLSRLASEIPSFRLLQISGCEGFIQLRVVACTDAAVRSVTAIEHLHYLFEYKLPDTANISEETRAMYLARNLIADARAVNLAVRVRVPFLLGVIATIQDKVADAYVDQVYDGYE